MCHKPVDAAEDGVHRDFKAIVEWIALHRVLRKARLHAREAKLHYDAPVRYGVVEVLDEEPCSVGVATTPFLHQIGREDLGVHLTGPVVFAHLPSRQRKTVPDSDCRKPVERRDVYRLLVDLGGEHLRLRDAPGLARSLAIGGDALQPPQKVLLPNACRLVRHVLAELPPKIRIRVRYVRNMRIPPRHVLIALLPTFGVPIRQRGGRKHYK